MSGHLLLHLLANGEWHSLKELSDELDWNLEEVTEAVKSISPLVDFEEETQRLKIKSWVMKLPARHETEQGKASVGSFIIPPEANITIQNVVVYNCIDSDIELCAKVIDDKLRELTILKLYRPSTSSK